MACNGVPGVGELIRDQIPDRQGHAMPPDTMEGSYDIKDLDNLQIGYLYEGKLITDRTFGHATYGCAGCCAYGGIGYDGIYLEPNPLYGLVGGGDQYIAWATNVCDGTDNEVTATWSSSVTAVATINTSGYALFHSVGTSVITGTARLQSVENPSCRPQTYQSTAPANVFDVGATGPAYVFVGADANEIRANEYQVTNAAHTALPSPPGGTCCAASSDASDTVTLTPTGNNPFTFHVETLDQSVTAGDRRLTFEYDLSPGNGTSVQLNVTARKFAYLTNNSPGNDCHLQYGTNRTYVYTVYTHPDKTAVMSTDGLVGTAVGETFNPALTCATITGNGGLQPSGAISDNVTSGCSSAPLTCTQTSTQSLNVAGYPVRTNTLQWTSNGVIYTSNGPTQ